jgi:UDP-glucose 4-epimerase
VAIFLDHIKKGTCPVIFWDGEQTRDYVHVDDVVAANLHVLEKNIAWTYHVGTGIQSSVNTLWWICKKNISNELIPVHGSAISEPRFVSLNIEKLVATWWEPLVTLEEGIKKLIKA